MNGLIEIVSMLNGKVVVCVGVMASLSACQMIKIYPYDGLIGYQVMQQHDEQHVQVRYSDSDTRSWQSVEKNSLKSCAKLLNLVPEQVTMTTTAQNTVEKKIPLTTHIPAMMGIVGGTGSSTGGSGGSGGGRAQLIVSPDLQVTDYSVKKFKQLDVACSPR
jgi:hypothetical protein